MQKFEKSVINPFPWGVGGKICRNDSISFPLWGSRGQKYIRFVDIFAWLLYDCLTLFFEFSLFLKTDAI